MSGLAAKVEKPIKHTATPTGRDKPSRAAYWDADRCGRNWSQPSVFPGL